MKTKVILLVEDNPDDEELTLLAFKKAPIANEVVVAHDGAEALEYLFGKDGSGGCAEPPAIILLDLKLPKVDGLEVLRRIRAQDTTRYVPVIVLTTSREDQDVAESYRLGCNSYVRKPVNFANFSEAAGHLGMYWLLLNEVPKRC